MTPSTSATPYCSAASLLLLADGRTIADLVNDTTAPPPTASDLADQTTGAGAKVQAALLAASGEIESACLPRGQYTPADLASLPDGSAGRRHLERVVAGLALGVLFGRRYPASGQWEELPAVRYASDQLERLRVGERVFGFLENVAAGTGAGTTPVTDQFDRDGFTPRNTVGEAYRFFGERGYR